MRRSLLTGTSPRLAWLRVMGLEASGVLEIPSDLPYEVVVDWAEVAVTVEAVRLISSHPDWRGIPPSGSVLFSDNETVAGFGASTAFIRSREFFAPLFDELISSGCAWVGAIGDPSRRDSDLWSRAHQLAVDCRGPHRTPFVPGFRPGVQL